MEALLVMVKPEDSHESAHVGQIGIWFGLKSLQRCGKPGPRCPSPPWVWVGMRGLWARFLWINPKHAHMVQIAATKVRLWQYDARLRTR